MTIPNDKVPESMLDPVGESHRIFSVDVLRGVAVLGILLINIVGMALPGPAYWDPSGFGGGSGWNLRAFVICNLGIEGTMRGIFSMLFGAGVILFTERKETVGAGPELAIAWYRRTIWLILFGLVHAYLLLWPGEVLYAYGIVGMFLFPVRHVRPWKLIGFAMFIFLAITFLNIHEYRKAGPLSENAHRALSLQDSGNLAGSGLSEDLAQWNALVGELAPGKASRERTIAQMCSGYFSAVKILAPISLRLQTGWFFRHAFLDILGMMLLGMGLFRLGILQGQRSWKLYALMVAVGYGVGIPVNGHETSAYAAGGFSALSYFRIQQTYELGRIFTTMGHVGLVMGCLKTGIFPSLKRALAATGRMALTNYMMQTVIATTLFVGFRQYGQWERYQLYFLVAAVWIFQLCMSPLWLRHYYFGPVEWLWRWLTYGKKPLFRREGS